MLHHLFHAVQPIVVTHPVDQPDQRHVRRVEFAGARGNELIQARGCLVDVVVEMDWAAEQFVVDGLHPSGHGCGVTVEAGGEAAGSKPGSDNRTALADRGLEHRSTTPCTKVLGNGKPWRGLSSPHSWVMCIDGNVMTVLSNGPCSRRSHDRPEVLDVPAGRIRRRPPIEDEHRRAGMPGRRRRARHLCVMLLS